MHAFIIIGSLAAHQLMDGHIIGSRICGQCCVFGMLADLIIRDYVMRFACAAAVELRTSAGIRTEFSLWFTDCFIAANNNVKSLPQAPSRPVDRFSVSVWPKFVKWADKTR